MNKTFANVIRYFAWNAMIMGSLVLSTVFGFQTGITILGWFFGIESAMCLILCFSPSYGLEKLAKETSIFRAYKIPFELAFVALAFYLKHYYIGICMFVTLFAWIYLFASTAKYRGIKEESKELKND